MKFYGVWSFQIKEKSGEILKEWTSRNLVVNQGLEYALDVALLSGTQITTWYGGLMSDTPTPSTSASHTLAAHAGWTEETGYTGNRQSWTGVRTSQTADNAADLFEFEASGADMDVAGAFLCSASTGTTGNL